MTYRESKFATYSSTFEQKSLATNVTTNQLGANDLCARCSCPIYPLELMGSIMGKKYHRVCFKCSVCDRQLDLKTFHTNQVDISDTQIYCQSHAPKNGKGTITFHSASSSKSNSPSFQSPCLNKSKSQDNIDMVNVSRVSPAVNEIQKSKSRDELKTIDDEHSTVITIPVIIKTEPSKPVTNGKLNELGTKLVELSKSNIDLRLPNEDEDNLRYSRDITKSPTTKPTVTFDSPVLVTDNTKENFTYSPTTVKELYLYDHEIDQLIKDLEENKQSNQFMDLEFINNSINNSNTKYPVVLVDSVLDKGVVVDKVPTSTTNTVSVKNTSQESYSSQSSSTKVESHSTSHVAAASHSETVYHSTNSNISNKIQYFIEQNSNKQAEYNRQNSEGFQGKLEKQISVDDLDSNKKYISVLLPATKDSSSKGSPSNEMFIIKSDNLPNGTINSSNVKYVEIIHPTPEPEKQPLKHSLSNKSVKSNENVIENSITVRPVPILSAENTILGENSCLGAIKLTVYYDELRHRLSITIHEAQNLKNLDKSKKTVSDPYCRIYLLPDDKQKTLKRKTKVVKDNLNPKWEETFDYKMDFNTAESKDLIVNLKDERGIFQKAEDCFMGEILLRLKHIDIKKQYTRWIYLQPMNAVSKLLLSSGIKPYS